MEFNEREIKLIINGLHNTIDRLGYNQENLEKELEELIAKIGEENE